MDLDIQSEIVVITEPTTLLPHFLSIYQQTAMILEMGAERQVNSDRRVREHRYRYPGVSSRAAETRMRSDGRG